MLEKKQEQDNSSDIEQQPPLATPQIKQYITPKIY